MKKIISFALACITLLAVLIIPCYAYGAEAGVQPRWDNISNINFSFSFNGANSNVTALIYKKSGVSSMEATLTVYEDINGEWEYVASASKSSSRSTLSVTVQFNAVSGREYKAVLDVTAYKNGVGENDVLTTYEICP